MSVGISAYKSNHVSKIQSNLVTAAFRLQSGKFNNSAADDSAGSAIVQRLEAVNREFDTSIRNGSDMSSVVETADGAVSGIESNLQRLRELAVQSANGILSDNDRAAINAEAYQLTEEIGGVIDGTEFNGKKILSEAQSFNMQLGPGEAGRVSFSTQALSDEIGESSLRAIDLSRQSGAADAIEQIDQMLQVTANQRSEYGAAQNRLKSSIENLAANRQSVSASKSRLEDADVAKEVADLSKAKLLQQATLGIQAQANARAGSVLALLGGS